MTKHIRRSYKHQENEFLLECFKSIDIESRKQKWKEIAKKFNTAFPEIVPPRTYKELEDHFTHSLDPSLKRENFTQEENEYILKFISESGRQWKTIALNLRRNENQVKNHFYRKLAKEITKTETIETAPQINVPTEPESVDRFFVLNFGELFFI